jgi:subtilisin family serine protease
MWHQQRRLRVLRPERMTGGPSRSRLGLGVAMLVVAATSCVSANALQPPAGPVRVAIIDTGVDRTASLARVLAPVDRLSAVPGTDVDDADGHGTELAELLHLHAPDAQLVSVRAFAPGPQTSDAWLADAVRLAVENRAGVVLLAVSGAEPLPMTEQAIRDAGQADVLVVVAAGNQGLDLARAPSYPASYDIDTVIAVSAADRSGQALASSNRGGPTFVNAPGLAVETCSRDGAVTTMQGTSPAAAIVAGTAAEMLARRPTRLAQLRGELQVAAYPSLSPDCASPSPRGEPTGADEESGALSGARGSPT